MKLEDKTRPAWDLPSLVIELPDGRTVRHPLRARVITIGRDPGNRICIPNHLVSKFHAKLVRSGGVFTVVDQASANKTRVNGRVVTQAALEFGDEIQFAGVKCRFLRSAPQVSRARSAPLSTATLTATPAETKTATCSKGHGGVGGAGGRSRLPVKPAVVGAALILLALLAALVLRLILSSSA